MDASASLPGGQAGRQMGGQAGGQIAFVSRYPATSFTNYNVPGDTLLRGLYVIWNLLAHRCLQICMKFVAFKYLFTYYI